MLCEPVSRYLSVSLTGDLLRRLKASNCDQLAGPGNGGCQRSTVENVVSGWHVPGAVSAEIQTVLALGDAQTNIDNVAILGKVY